MFNSKNRSYESGQTECSLHHFPDIPVGNPDDDRHCLPPEENFQRVQFDHLDSSCAKLTSGSDGKVIRHSKDMSSATNLNEQAYQKGFADGKEKGLIDGENRGIELGITKIDPLLSSLQEALLQLKKIREVTSQHIEKEVVKLALAIAKQVICREITIDRETVVCVAREALTKVDDTCKIKIKMSPSDLQFINESKHKLTNPLSNFNNAIFEAEESIQSGGCIIETDLGEIDARIEKQLQAVEESFRKILEK